MRNSATESQPAMIGPRILKDYICRQPEELFDLEDDPTETKNLAADPSYAEVLRGMRAAVERWQLDTGDPWMWRDGVSTVRYFNSNYMREGLKIPDSFDFDADQPGLEGKTMVDLSLSR
ncbi:hypothetical protein F5884DRAFT_755804 [Xylogone sp. PMI_703]|nr:hypothetical protein F5884DRAFT_755804 [Xylogone sp. PMI_703]